MRTAQLSQLGRLQVTALVSAAAGLLSMIPLPAGLRFLLLAVFILVGPGSAVLHLLPPLERSLKILVLPAIGISLVILASTAAVELDLWSPTLQLLVLAALTCALALTTRAGDRKQVSPTAAGTGAA